jgi:hypothetical protein
MKIRDMGHTSASQGKYEMKTIDREGRCEGMGYPELTQNKTGREVSVNTGIHVEPKQ